MHSFCRGRMFSLRESVNFYILFETPVWWVSPASCCFEPRGITYQYTAALT